MPRNIRVLADEDVGIATYRASGAPEPRVILERHWRNPALYPYLVFWVLFDGLLLAYYAGLLNEDPWGKETGFGALVFPLIQVGSVLFLTYATLCHLVNRTRIAVESGVLSVRHGPLPWPGNRTMAVAELSQLFCEEHVTRKGPRTYSVNALLKAGGKVTLLRGLKQPDQALYIEQLLETRLGIVDVPVPEEYT
jgi:hypothetical protein